MAFWDAIGSGVSWIAKNPRIAGAIGGGAAGLYFGGGMIGMAAGAGAGYYMSSKPSAFLNKQLDARMIGAINSNSPRLLAGLAGTKAMSNAIRGTGFGAAAGWGVGLVGGGLSYLGGSFSSGTASYGATFSGMGNGYNY